MFDFMRHKVVNVAQLDQETLGVHGILDDSIYSIELNFKVHISDLVCSEIEGRWLRWTTTECPKAIDFLKEADGFCLKPGIDDKIHKTVGRRSCRHFANLFIECGHAVRETVKLIHWEQANATDPEISLKQFMQNEEQMPAAQAVEDPPEIPSATVSENQESPPKSAVQSPKISGPGQFNGEGFVIDMHLHTSPASPCASDSVDAMIEEAKRIGLNGICLSDHNHVWPAEEVQALREKHDFTVLRANEIITEQGDMLVFGFDEDIKGIIKLVALKEKVAAVGGFIVAAHPFRGFLTFGADDVGLTIEKAMDREAFKWVDGVETRNGKVTDTENELAVKVAGGLGLPATGGSDAHDVSTVGTYATVFEQAIDSEQTLLAALKQGRYRPVAFR